MSDPARAPVLIMLDGEVVEADAAARGALILDPPVAPVPAAITPRQARLELHARGLLEAVEAVVAAADPAVRIEWEYGTQVDRDSPLIGVLSSQVPGLDAEAIDEIFRAASAR